MTWWVFAVWAVDIFGEGGRECDDLGLLGGGLAPLPGRRYVMGKVVVWVL